MLASNYRPVACLPAASKVLESVVLGQISSYFEKLNLLPLQQHGFRAGRSTTTAIASMVSEWTRAHEKGLSTGILLWDLSSAFDTIDVDLLCSKLGLYGVAERTVGWFRSFLTNRKQRVQVGSSTSEPKTVSIGCPQGSLLSPLLFLIYVADLELWVRDSVVSGYADDTATFVSDESDDTVIHKLEADAKRILGFMASNFLSANADKTGFLFIEKKRSASSRSITVGNKLVMEQSSHRVLGLQVDNRLSWQEHVHGVDPSVNWCQHVENFSPESFFWILSK